MKKGSLVILRSHRDVGIFRNNNSTSPTLYEVTRAPYTARFMEAIDREMEAGGMGDLAGVYTSAIDVIAITGPDSGNKYQKQRFSKFKIYVTNKDSQPQHPHGTMVPNQQI